MQHVRRNGVIVPAAIMRNGDSHLRFVELYDEPPERFVGRLFWSKVEILVTPPDMLKRHHFELVRSGCVAKSLRIHGADYHFSPRACNPAVLRRSGADFRGSFGSSAVYRFLAWWEEEGIGAMAQLVSAEEADGDIAYTTFHSHKGQTEFWRGQEGDGLFVTYDKESRANPWHFEPIFPGKVVSAKPGIWHMIATRRRIANFLVMVGGREPPPHDHHYEDVPEYIVALLRRAL